MRLIPLALAGFVALTAVSAQAVPSREGENWRPLSTAPLSGGGVGAFQIDDFARTPILAAGPA